MKILMTTSFYPPFHIGGDATNVKLLAEALSKGHEVHVLHSMDAYNLKKKERRKVEDSEGILTVHTMHSPLGRLEPIMNYCIGSRSYTLNFFRRLVEQEGFDVVHHHNISLLGYGLLRKTGNYKNIYTAHDYWLICPKYDLFVNKGICTKRACIGNCLPCCAAHKKPYQLFRHTSAFNRAIKDIDTIIAPSDFMKARLSRQLKKRIETLHYFVPEPAVQERVDGEEYFIYAGVLEHHKGLMNLVKVFSRLPHLRLFIAGSGSLYSRIKKTKTRNVFLLGWRNHDDLFRLLANAQALVVPSIWAENMPMVAIEALSLGTPVIGSDKGGIPEIVSKIDKQLIFKSHDLEGLANILRSFKRKDYPRSKLREIHQEYFSPKNYLRGYEKIITS
ncbi:hypothetical protein AUJ69_00525 [Candidatus Woesearchaeota archaeon CG1_02_47_18]|nr:MAG: hypothetical protein AUJ69_00525 [Candidatus Woesearchaeota archaeon CG1_02_47_18]